VRNTLDPRGDAAEIRGINAQVTGLNQQITALQCQMAALGCPETPLPGGPQILWALVGNTAGFGRGRMIEGRPIWIGDFRGDGRADVPFHFRGDLSW
jgi:hypothetical protein